MAREALRGLRDRGGAGCRREIIGIRGVEVRGVGVVGHKVIKEDRGNYGSLRDTHPSTAESGAGRLMLAAHLSPVEVGRHPSDDIVAEVGLEDVIEKVVMGDGVERFAEVDGHDGGAGWGLWLVEASGY